MSPDELRALADALEPMAAAPRFDCLPVVEFCAWLRQCAEAEPVARICTDAEMRHRDGRWGRVKWIEAESELPEGALLYTHPAPVVPQAEPVSDPRPCTCHPDDSPPVPCARKYALSECRTASGEPTEAQIEAAAHEYASWNHKIVFGDEGLMRRVAADMLRAALAAKEG